jgi:hypothetical protein
MVRKPPSDSAVTTVLLRSRRRCCICFGLNRDAQLKSGQIAHLDQNNANNAEENLAFLCLDHHDEYDSSTRQRKGLTQAEVKAYRSELYEHLGRFLQVEVHFGSITLPPEDPYAGSWIRLGGSNDSAEITLTPLGDGPIGNARYAVTGFALWGTQREYGPNIGDFSFIEELEEGRIQHFQPRYDDEVHAIVLKFEGAALTVTEENWLGQYGMNVNFEGEYRRAR